MAATMTTIHCTKNEVYRSFLLILSHLRKKLLMENIIFCAVITTSKKVVKDILQIDLRNPLNFVIAWHLSINILFKIFDVTLLIRWSYKVKTHELVKEWQKLFTFIKTTWSTKPQNNLFLSHTENIWSETENSKWTQDKNYFT